MSVAYASRAPDLRLAVAQIPMHWEMADNVRAMKTALAMAHVTGARLCTFPELAVTGFHRRIQEWAREDLVNAALRELCECAASLEIAAAFGSPTFDANGACFNSHVFVDAAGHIAGHVTKSGLTPAEATVFAHGATRPVIAVDSLACSAVICREVEDREEILRQLGPARLDLILWPGQMRPDPTKPVEDPPAHCRNAQSLARATGAFVVQANWPNTLNRPEESEHAGRSACIAGTGELLFRLPVRAFGLGVFDLGDRNFAWHPWPADR